MVVAAHQTAAEGQRLLIGWAKNVRPWSRRPVSMRISSSSKCGRGAQNCRINEPGMFPSRIASQDLGLRFGDDFLRRALLLAGLFYNILYRNEVFPHSAGDLNSTQVAVPRHDDGRVHLRAILSSINPGWSHCRGEFPPKLCLRAGATIGRFRSLALSQGDSLPNP